MKRPTRTQLLIVFVGLLYLIAWGVFCGLLQLPVWVGMIGGGIIGFCLKSLATATASYITRKLP